MQTIVLSQVFQEELFLDQWITWIYPLVDKMVFSEGLLSPFSKLQQRSIDKTMDILNNWTKNKDYANKITYVNAISEKYNSREKTEGTNKQNLLKLAKPENGDLIIIGDVDEFWFSDRFYRIIDLFKNNDKIMHVPVEEYQFAYNLSLAFKASHDGRFMRYIDGARFGTTNHFIHPNKGDITKDYQYLQKREDTLMCHLCWARHPMDIRQKVLSFNRPSFTAWFNHVYLEYPDNPEIAYKNNSRIPPYFGRGFAEGQHEKLEPFHGHKPESLFDINIDYLNYIKENKKLLLIQ